MTINQIRTTKRKQIENFFNDNLGRSYASSALHRRFGPSFRSRVSEINRDPERIVTIHNRYIKHGVFEKSEYYATGNSTVRAEAAAALVEQVEETALVGAY